MNVVTDIMIMAIPAPVLISVKTTLWKRIGLLALFGAGFFIMVAAVLRVAMVLVVSCHSSPSRSTTTNTTLPPPGATSVNNVADEERSNSSHLVLPRGLCRHRGRTGHRNPTDALEIILAGREVQGQRGIFIRTIEEQRRARRLV